MEGLYNIINEIPGWVPFAGFGLVLTGMATQMALSIRGNTKRANSRFEELKAEYRDDFSKDELLSYYEELVTIGPNPSGKRRNEAFDMIGKINDTKIRGYIFDEIRESLENPIKILSLDQKDGLVETLSPTYYRVTEILRE